MITVTYQSAFTIWNVSTLPEAREIALAENVPATITLTVVRGKHDSESVVLCHYENGVFDFNA